MRRRKLAPAPTTSPTTAPSTAAPRRTRRREVEPATGQPSGATSTPATVPTLSFVRFCEDVIGVQFEAGQRVFYSVAADGVDPIDLDPDDREVARELFGDVDRIPQEARKIVVAVKGADIGWSYFMALRMVHRCLTARVSDAAAGETRWCLTVCPDLELAGMVVSYARGAVETTHALAHMLVSTAGDSIVMERPDGAAVGIRSRAAAIGGRGGRGHRLIEAGMDEAGFHRDRDTGKVNAEDIFSPISARLRDGQLWVGSTPWLASGLLYDLFTANFGKPRTALAARLPTVAMRSDPYVLDNVRREYERDPDSAAREVGCEFLGAGSSQFFDELTLIGCVDDALMVPAALVTGPTHAGCDFGFSRNSSVLAVLEQVGNVHELVRLVEVKPARGEPLKPSRVGASFKATMKACGCLRFAADGHYKESIKEHTSGLVFDDAPAGQVGKALVYVTARTAMREGKIKLPNDPRLLKQLRQTVSKALPGGGLAISAPTWRGGEHGDLVSALVLAIWEATRAGASEGWGDSMRDLMAADDAVYAGGDHEHGLLSEPLDDDFDGYDFW